MSDSVKAAAVDADAVGRVLKANEVEYERRDVMTMVVIGYAIAGLNLAWGLVSLVWVNSTLLAALVPVAFAAVLAGLAFFASKLSLWSGRVLVALMALLLLCRILTPLLAENPSYFGAIVMAIPALLIMTKMVPGLSSVRALLARETEPRSYRSAELVLTVLAAVLALLDLVVLYQGIGH